MLKCGHCSKTFTYESQRKRHELSHIPQHECKICCKKFSFLSALQRHEKQHERTGKIECKHCGKSFQDADLLKRHINYKHKGHIICSTCDAVFNSELALKTHSKIHEPASRRKYNCNYEGCQKSFSFSHHLKHHQLTHTNEKQYFCGVCEKGFIQQHHWKSHIRTHIKDNWFTCGAELSCGKRFSTKYALRRHEITHTSKTRDTASKQETTEENFEKTFNIDKFKLNLSSEQTTAGSNNNKLNPCNGCIIRESCDIINKKSNNNCCAINKELPLTECKSDGTVKLVDLFDIDIDYGNTEVKKTEETKYFDKEINGKNEEKEIAVNKKDNPDAILYNSCKAVLGNCIVSDDGSVGDECLCAKMTAEDQISAQEIEEITPIEWKVS